MARNTTVKGLQGLFKEFKASMRHEQRELMRGLMETTKNRAVAKFGVYQPQAGQFAPWKPLAPATRRIREEQGFTPNDPLLRTGKLRDSVGGMHGADWAEVGSNDKVMLIMEVGDDNTPARPVFGPTLVESETEIRAAVAQHVKSVFDKSGVRVRASFEGEGGGAGVAASGVPALGVLPDA